VITPDHVLAGVRDALRAIGAPRLFETERGYQGALLGQLDPKAPSAGSCDRRAGIPEARRVGTA